MEALAVGTFALVSAVAYLASLQQEEAPPTWSSSGFMHAGGGILPSVQAASADGAASTSVTDRVFAARAHRNNKLSVA
jgi:hypothetical protein